MKSETIGKTRWLIPDGYMSDTEKGDFVSHEAVCVLNLSGETAHISLTLYFGGSRADARLSRDLRA